MQPSPIFAEADMIAEGWIREINAPPFFPNFSTKRCLSCGSPTAQMKTSLGSGMYESGFPITFVSTKGGFGRSSKKTLNLRFEGMLSSLQYSSCTSLPNPPAPMMMRFFTAQSSLVCDGSMTGLTSSCLMTLYMLLKKMKRSVFRETCRAYQRS